MSTSPNDASTWGRASQIAVAALVLALAAVAIAGTAWYQQPRVGYIDSSRLMQEYDASVEAQKKMQKQQKQWQQNIRTLQSEANALEQSLLKGQVASSNVPAVRDTLERKRQQMARYRQAIQKKSRELQTELMQPVFSTLNAEITEFGKNRGYDIILGTLQGGNILYAHDATDVTDEFLRYIDDSDAKSAVPDTSQSQTSGSQSSESQASK